MIKQTMCAVLAIITIITPACVIDGGEGGTGVPGGITYGGTDGDTDGDETTFGGITADGVDSSGGDSTGEPGADDESTGGDTTTGGTEGEGEAEWGSYNPLDFDCNPADPDEMPMPAMPDPTIPDPRTMPGVTPVCLGYTFPEMEDDVFDFHFRSAHTAARSAVKIVVARYKNGYYDSEDDMPPPCEAIASWAQAAALWDRSWTRSGNGEYPNPVIGFHRSYDDGSNNSGIPENQEALSGVSRTANWMLSITNHVGFVGHASLWNDMDAALTAVSNLHKEFEGGGYTGNPLTDLPGLVLVDGTTCSYEVGYDSPM